MPTELTEAPAGFRGSLPEYLVFKVLTQKVRPRMVEGVHFIMITAFERGGRGQLGGLEADFMFMDPPNLAFEIQGIYWHYQQGGAQLMREAADRGIFESRGIRLVHLDEDDLLEDAEFYVREGLRGIDHSRIVRGLR